MRPTTRLLSVTLAGALALGGVACGGDDTDIAEQETTVEDESPVDELTEETDELTEETT